MRIIKISTRKDYSKYVCVCVENKKNFLMLMWRCLELKIGFTEIAFSRKHVHVY